MLSCVVLCALFIFPSLKALYKQWGSLKRTNLMMSIRPGGILFVSKWATIELPGFTLVLLNTTFVTTSVVPQRRKEIRGIKEILGRMQ